MDGSDAGRRVCRARRGNSQSGRYYRGGLTRIRWCDRSDHDRLATDETTSHARHRLQRHSDRTRDGAIQDSPSSHRGRLGEVRERCGRSILPRAHVVEGIARRQIDLSVKRIKRSADLRQACVAKINAWAADGCLAKSPHRQFILTEGSIGLGMYWGRFYRCSHAEGPQSGLTYLAQDGLFPPANGLGFGGRVAVSPLRT